MEVSTDKGYQIVARKLMEEILYDNGCIRGQEPDTPRRYPKKHLDAITQACELYFEAHPDLLNDDNLHQIGVEEYNENKEKFGKYPEWQQLEDALYVYFEQL